MIGFYKLTGDRKFLARLPEALDWLDQVKTPQNLIAPGRTHPTFILEGSNTPVYIHRKRVQHRQRPLLRRRQPEQSDRPLRLVPQRRHGRHPPRIRGRRRHGSGRPDRRLAAQGPGRVAEAAEILHPARRQRLGHVDRRPPRTGPGPEAIAAVCRSWTATAAWITPLTTTSNPYNGEAPAAVTGGEYQTTRVGDLWDVSPYTTDFPVDGISTAVFIRRTWAT
jgi:hypothetical protein